MHSIINNYWMQIRYTYIYTHCMLTYNVSLHVTWVTEWWLRRLLLRPVAWALAGSSPLHGLQQHEQPKTRANLGSSRATEGFFGSMGFAFARSSDTAACPGSSRGAGGLTSFTISLSNKTMCLKGRLWGTHPKPEPRLLPVKIDPHRQNCVCRKQNDSI